MASRGTRKVGTHRMDGAIAALTPLGFSRKLIRDTIKELIKEYGDDEAGWYFVEENYYKLVIDNIIEEQCEDKEGHNLLEEKEKAKSLLEGSTSETCGQAFLQLAESSNNGDNSCKANFVHENSPLKLEGPLHIVPYTEHCQVNPSPPPVRRPCYGWISEDEEE